MKINNVYTCASMYLHWHFLECIARVAAVHAVAQFKEFANMWVFCSYLSHTHFKCQTSKSNHLKGASQPLARWEYNCEYSKCVYKLVSEVYSLKLGIYARHGTVNYRFYGSKLDGHSTRIFPHRTNNIRIKYFNTC